MSVLESIEFRGGYRSASWLEIVAQLSDPKLTRDYLVSCLYAVGDMPWVDQPSPLEAVTLLLKAVKSPDQRVSAVAGHILMSRLSKVREQEAREKVLAWLSDTSGLEPKLLGPPYPRFVQEWLVNTCAGYMVACCRFQSKDIMELPSEMIRAFTESKLLACLLSWGRPDFALIPAMCSAPIRGEVLKQALTFAVQHFPGIQFEPFDLMVFSRALQDLSMANREAHAILAKRAHLVVSLCYTFR